MSLNELTVTTKCGEHAWDYLRNKRRGGDNNFKGAGFESFYSLYQIARNAHLHESDCDKIYPKSQVLAFVDDLLIENIAKSENTFHQLKNVASLSWGAGDKSLADDFLNQSICNQPSDQLKIVVSSKEVAKDLEDNMPSNLIGKVTIEQFTYATTLREVIQFESDFLDCIAAFCPTSESDESQIEAVSTTLLGVWLASDQSSLSISDLFKKASDHSPNFVRPLSAKYELPKDVEDILSGISGLKFSTDRCFFYFTDGIFSGFFPHHCYTESYTNFEKRIRTQRPTSIESLMELL